MEKRLISKILRIEGMSCTNCENRIENALKKLDGVVKVKAVYSSSNVYITYDANVIRLERIIRAIEEQDYTVMDKPETESVTGTNAKKAAGGRISAGRLLGIGIILLAFYLVIEKTAGFNFIPEINQSMGYGILFVVGFLTSLHCIAMCGGINLSQCVSYRADDGDYGRLSKIKPGLLYNCGRVVSYTVIGGIAGALGTVIGFSGTARGIVAVAAGIFMVIMGLNMLNVFPRLRKLNPRMPKIFGEKIYSGRGKYGPLFVGLLNGLMPCGPLQAMQIYALGTGSFTAGALSMFMFSIGTVPLMFGFGAVSSIIGRKFTHKMMKLSAVLVIVLGVVMANRGLALSGLSIPYFSFGTGSSSQVSGVARVQDGVQTVTTRLSPGRYEPITVQKGVPVKWVIQARKDDINGCNNEIVIPEFKVRKKLKTGENIIEFTPAEAGTFVYSCWMGMIRSRITVVDDIKHLD